MIGYGDIVPKTKWGKIGVMIYACFGIPVYILYFMNMGKVFARILKWLYTKAYRLVINSLLQCNYLIIRTPNRWNVKRKWKQAVNYEGMGSDDGLDEAYMDELEQQVINILINYRLSSLFLLGYSAIDNLFVGDCNIPFAWDDNVRRVGRLELLGLGLLLRHFARENRLWRLRSGHVQCYFDNQRGQAGDQLRVPPPRHGHRRHVLLLAQGGGRSQAGLSQEQGLGEVSGSETDAPLATMNLFSFLDQL